MPASSIRTPARRPLRRPALWGLAGAGAVVVLWAPSLVATLYQGDRPASDYLARPDLGWSFMYDAVTLSRGARLGSEPGALREAREVWAGPPAVARSVRLEHVTRPFTVPVPAGGVAPAPGKRVVRPRSDLAWTVRGPVRGGPDQVIGVLDYHSGRVVWDIRPVSAS